jgi:hypothetical protein
MGVDGVQLVVSVSDASTVAKSEEFLTVDVPPTETIELTTIERVSMLVSDFTVEEEEASRTK